MDATQRWNRRSVLFTGLGVLLTAAGCNSGPPAWFARNAKPKQADALADRQPPARYGDFDRKLSSEPGTAARFEVAGAAQNAPGGGQGREPSAEEMRKLLFKGRSFASRDAVPQTSDPFLDFREKQSQRNRSLPAAHAQNRTTQGIAAQTASHATSSEENPFAAYEKKRTPPATPSAGTNRFAPEFDRKFENSFGVASAPQTTAPRQPAGRVKLQSDHKAPSARQPQGGRSENPFANLDRRPAATNANAKANLHAESDAARERARQAEAIRRAMLAANSSPFDSPDPPVRQIYIAPKHEPVVIPRGTTITEADPALVFDSEQIPRDRPVFSTSDVEIHPDRRGGNIEITPRSNRSPDRTRNAPQQPTAQQPGRTGDSEIRRVRGERPAADNVNRALLNREARPDPHPAAILPEPADPRT